MIGIWKSGVNTIVYAVIWLLFVAYLSSYVIQDSFYAWMILNGGVVLLIAACLFLAWRKHRNFPKRVSMLSALAAAVFMMIPLLVHVFPSIYFIIILLGNSLLFPLMYRQSKPKNPGYVERKWRALFIYASMGIAAAIILFCLLIAILPEMFPFEFWTIAAIVLYAFGTLLGILIMEILHVLEKTGQIKR
ncbi:small nuclear ribonucleoprotein sm d1 [Bacillus sp. OxB-1]|nr:small nuclear ribonucleoprotein sm d1 [Bacillus sp. OxB-1]